MKVTVVVAMSTNRVIGRNNKLPWYIPGDLKFFKQVTMGKPVVMGRKTYESIGKPLPGRDNIVITRDRSWKADGVKVAHDIDQALTIAKASAETSGAAEVMVIGGAQIYEAVMPLAVGFSLTRVRVFFEGVAAFHRRVGVEGEEISGGDFRPQVFIFLDSTILS